MTDWRIISSVSLLSVALLPIFALNGLPESLWFVPYIFISVSLLSLSLLWRQHPKTALLIGTFGICSVITSYIVRAPSMGLYGYDANITISILQRMIENGSLVQGVDGPIRGADKVENYPGLYLTGTIVVNFTGLSPMLTTKILPLVFLPILPLLGYAMTQAKTSGKVAAATLWTVPTFYMSHSGAAVPQQFGLVLFGVFFYFFLHGHRNLERAERPLYWIAFVAITFSLVLSHSLTPFIAALAMPLMFVLTVFQPKKTTSAAAVLYSVMAVGIWVYNETRIIFVEGIFAIVTLLGSRGNAVPIAGRKPGQISLLPIPIYRYPISWVMIFGRIPLYIAAGVSSLFVMKSYLFEKPKEVDTLALAMFFAGGATLITMVLGPVSTKRGWIFLSLLSAPAIGYMICTRDIVPVTLRMMMKISLLLAVVVSTFAIPMNTFAPEATPESLTGRDLYPGEEVHGSTEWLDSYTDRSTSAVTGTRFFMFEERYRHPTQGTADCYQQSCTASFVFWHEEFREGWFNQDLGTFHQFPDGESVLSTRRHRIFHSGDASIYR